MTETTHRLALPLIVPGQAQKEMTHNEALAMIDILLHATVQGAGSDMPPVDPQDGDCWIVGDSPTGAWTGRPGAIAGWTAGGWRFVPPRDGMSVAVPTTGATARYSDGSWSMLLPSAAIPAPAGGDVVDLQARSVIGAIIAVLRDRALIDP